MSVIPAIKSGNDEKHSAAGAEVVTVCMCVNCIVNNTAIRTISYSSAVMDDLILCSYRLAAYSSSAAGTFLSDNVVLWAYFELLLAVSNLLVAVFRKAARLSPAFAYLIWHRPCLLGDTEAQSGVKRPVFICVTALMSISAMDHLTHVDRSGVDPRLTSYTWYIVAAASWELLSMPCGSRRSRTQAVWKYWSAKEQQTNARFPEKKLEGRNATSTQETRTRVPPPYRCSTLHPAQRQNTL